MSYGLGMWLKDLPLSTEWIDVCFKYISEFVCWNHFIDMHAVIKERKTTDSKTDVESLPT